MFTFKQFLAERPYVEAPEKVTPESVPDKLYHATDTMAKATSILRHGLRASKDANTHNYSGQKAGVIYLAAKPLEEADNIKAFAVNFEIDTTHPDFDKTKVYLDENRYKGAQKNSERDVSIIVQTWGNVYFEYVADLIPPHLIKIHDTKA